MWSIQKERFEELIEGTYIQHNHYFKNTDRYFLMWQEDNKTLGFCEKTEDSYIS